MIKTLWLVVGLCFWSAAAHAQCAPLPYTLTNGTIADANQVMANFNAVNTCAQGAAPTAATNTTMAALLTSAIPNKAIIRLGFATTGDAPAQVFITENGTCAANSRINDGGSCVNTTSGDGNSLYAVFPPAGADSREWGAVPGGGDATAAIQACLTGVGAGGTCFAQGGRYTVSGTLNIPANTTLSCGWYFADSEGTPAAFGTMPALLINSAHSIQASGESATIKNCLVERGGMTFPAPNSSAYAGIGLLDNGNAGFAVLDTVVIGFDTCVWWSAQRPHGHRIFYDCNGVTHPAMYVTTGGTDSGEITYVKGQPLATGNGSCTASVRAGTGFGVGGGVGGTAFWRLDNVVVQNFAVAQYDFENDANIGAIWADNINGAASCGAPGYGSSIGVKIGVGFTITADQVDIYENQTGMLALGNGSETFIGTLLIANSGQDGLQVGNATNPGNLHVNALVEGSNARYAVFMGHANSNFQAHTVFASAQNGTAAPYFATGTNILHTMGPGPYGFMIDNLVTDLALGTNPYMPLSGTTGFVLNSGSARMLTNLNASLGTCTGLGSGGTCAFVAGSDAHTGVINLTTGTGPSGNGQVPFILPISADDLANCQIGTMSGWPAVSFQVQSVSRTTVNFVWASALTNPSTVAMGYTCNPM